MLDVPTSQRGYSVLPFERARELLDYLDPTRDTWYNSRNEAIWIFRGHGSDAWDLMPAAWRNERCPELFNLEQGIKSSGEYDLARLTPEKRERIRDALSPANEIDDVRLQNCIHAVATEYTAVWSFISLADELGFKVPSHFLPLEKPSLDEVIESVLVTKTFVGLFGPSIALAQHHGIPTRLLDFTRRPHVAAFFAAESALKLRLCASPAQNLAVWAFNLDRDYSQVFSLSCPRADHPFLHAQDALFLYTNDGEKIRYEEGRWPNLIEVLNRENAHGAAHSIQKLTLPACEIDELLTLLARERITRAHLMPTYDNVASTLRSRWSLAPSTG